MTAQTTSRQSDDELGEVLRAIVDKFVAAGIDPQTIIYAVTVANIRLALDIAPDCKEAVASVLRAIADITALHPAFSGRRSLDDGD